MRRRLDRPEPGGNDRTIHGDWRKDIEATARSRAHLWINDRSQIGWPIQSFARLVCHLVLKHRNTDPVRWDIVNPESLCDKCLTWYNANLNRV